MSNGLSQVRETLLHCDSMQRVEANILSHALDDDLAMLEDQYAVMCFGSSV